MTTHATYPIDFNETHQLSHFQIIADARRIPSMEKMFLSIIEDFLNNKRKLGISIN